MLPELRSKETSVSHSGVVEGVGIGGQGCTHAGCAASGRDSAAPVAAAAVPLPACASSFVSLPTRLRAANNPKQC